MIYTKQEIAKELSLSTKTIDRLILSGKLQACKIGRSVRITKNQLDAFLENAIYDPEEMGIINPASGINF